MTAVELREQVTKKYKEGQSITIKRLSEDKRKVLSLDARIEKFNMNTVLTRHDGYLESFTYWEFLQVAEPKEIKIPEKIKKLAAV